MRHKKRTEKAKPTEAALDAVDEALSDLEDFSGYVLSEAEVASDPLASALMTAFFPRGANPFAGKAPELYEVIEELHDSFELSEKAVDDANKIKELIEDAYGD